MDLQSRIVRRFLASKWDPPPALYKAVSSWAADVYAGHVLELVEDKLERFSHSSLLLQSKEALAEYQANGEAQIRSLKAGKKLRFKALYYGKQYDSSTSAANDFLVEHDDPAKLHSSELGEWRLGTGKGTRIDWWSRSDIQRVLEQFKSWLDSQAKKYDNVSRGKTPNPTEKSPAVREALINTHLLRQECLKYTSEGKRRANKVETRVPMDVTGWKYLRPDEQAEAQETIRAVWPRGIEVKMDFRNQHDEYVGLWTGSGIQLDAPAGDKLSVPTLALFTTRLNALLDTCWHECQHAGQDMLKVIRKLNEPAGLPSRELRQPGVTPWGGPDLTTRDPRKMKIREIKKKVPHYLRDIEFHTNLGNDTKALRRTLQKVPPKLRHKFFKNWVGLEKGLDVSDSGILTNYRLLKLRDEAPEKWEKLVAELWKAVHDLM